MYFFRLKKFIAHQIIAGNKLQNNPELFRTEFSDLNDLSTFNLIEKEREALLKNNSTLTVTDYGTGSKKNNKRTVREIAKKSLSKSQKSRFLYQLIKRLECKNGIELGTSLGINTMYLALGLKNGKMTTFEGCPEISAFAREIFARIGFNNIDIIEGNIDETINKLETINPVPDFIYIDANHTLPAVQKYLEKMKSILNENTVFVLDDIYWSKGMSDAWEYLKDFQSVQHSFDYYSFGFVLFKKIWNQKHYYCKLP